jgi:hypothetical protein
LVLPGTALAGSWPISTQILTWGPHLEPKQGREAVLVPDFWPKEGFEWKRARTTRR